MSPFSVDIFFVWRYRNSSSGNPSVLFFRKLPVVKRLRIREGGVSRYSVEIFLPDSAKIFLGRTLLCFRNFWLSNNFLPKSVMSPFSVDIFFVWRYRKFSSGYPSVLCFRKFLVTKGFLDKCGVLGFSVAIFLSHSREKFHRVILRCFKKLLISKNFMDGGGERHDFPSKIFCFTVPEIFVEHLFSVSLVSSLTIVYA